MQRPRNRLRHGGQRSGDRVPTRGRGGNSNPGRGRGPTHARDVQGSLPTTQQVIPGAPVSIVLKIDQPTGREVQGIVADVLTSGNHPRGIKVCLRDGRVGRVQRMVGEQEAHEASQGLSGLGRNGDIGYTGSVDAPFAGRARTYARSRCRGVHEQEQDLPSSGYSLGAFLPEDTTQASIQNISGPTDHPATALDFGSATRICPVCEAFEGDEMAVAHHVNEHFGD